MSGLEAKKCFASATNAKAYFLRNLAFSSFMVRINSFSKSVSKDYGRMKESTSRKASLKVFENTKNSFPASFSIKDDFTIENLLISSFRFSTGIIDSTLIFAKFFARSS